MGQGFLVLISDRPIVNVSYFKKVLTSLILSSFAIYVPYLFHLNLLGPTLLPMHFFAFIIALLFGWRLGLIFGLSLPFVSYFISGMPLLSNLILVMIEVGSYGFFAGVFKEKLNLNIWLCLLFSMIIGRFMISSIVYFFTDLNPIFYVESLISAGSLGIILQIIFVVPLTNLISKWIQSE